MPAMLGAQLGDLDALATELGQTAGSIGAAQARSTATTHEVVESVRAAALVAERQIQSHMEELRSAVARAASTTSSAVWTGANADRFRGAYHDFDSSMVHAEAATKETFADFERAIDTMAQALTDYAQTLATALQSAQASTESMRVAVVAQRSNLEQVMNSGLSVG